ncbi:MAG: SpoVR family protein [Hyphomicrobiales bacterium]
MELLDQHAKKIMEECKVRARDAGLSFDNESLEYIVTNRDLLELTPKGMIPTLYDFWVNDVGVLKEKGKYQLYPHNPYETVINSRPAISFYNDNNPDWLNIMIFYHVLGHIDFFQNNQLFRHTWNDDFVGQALADKRYLANLRSTHGRWVDYVIEFCRSIDNIIGYFPTLFELNNRDQFQDVKREEYYFGDFHQNYLKTSDIKYFEEVEKYNRLIESSGEVGDALFFSEIKKKYPEFESRFKIYKEKLTKRATDIVEYIRDNSQFLNKDENNWMKAVINIIRNTALYFAPQIRSKILNEGWASYWHDKLFRSDERIAGHEVDYAKVNAMVTSISRVGLNPYAIGLRLIQHVEDIVGKGQLSYSFQKLMNREKRKEFDNHTGKGMEAIFFLRNNFSDHMLIQTFVDQDFMNEHQLFVTGRRLNQQDGNIEYYVKSRKAEEYQKMLLNQLYHPPYITIDEENTSQDNLCLVHHFEGKQLVQDMIFETLVGIEFLWGNQVQLETTQIVKIQDRNPQNVKFELRKVLFTVKDRKLTKKNL